MTAKADSDILANLATSIKTVDEEIQNSLEGIEAATSSSRCEEEIRCYEEIISRLKNIQLEVKAIRKLQHHRTKKREKPPSSTRRSCLTSSMKYLAQWERVIEAQNEETNEDVEEELILLPKPIIKKRIRKFEKQERKRASSTAEGFLDGPGKTWTVQEDLEEEEEIQEHEVKTKPKIVDVVVSVFTY